MDFANLAAPFAPEAIHWRAQTLTRDKSKAMALAYLDARDVMDRLDEVCSPTGWQSEFTETAKGRVICRIGIRCGDDWIWKADGAGDTDVEGEKGALSDALKRAAVSWGVGRYLYRIKSPWVPCEVNDRGQWKAWKDDPWKYVRGAPPAPPAKPPRPDATKIRDQMKGAIEGARKLVNLHAIENDPRFCKDMDLLIEHDQPKANEVRTALESKRESLAHEKVA